MAKKKAPQIPKAREIEYKTQAEPRAMIGDIPVFCSFDKLAPIGELEEHPRNPNQHSDAQIELLAEIIKAQGWRAPVTVSKRSGLIIRGHGRYRAALHNGQDVVPVDYQNYDTEAEELADLVADNRLSELSYIDGGELKDLLLDLDTGGDIDTLLTGFDTAAMEDLMTENGNIPLEPEMEFSEELLEEHNYIVLYFDNPVDWQQALTLFDIQTVRKPNADAGWQQEAKGVGRVLKGSEAIEKITGIGSAAL